MDEKSPFEYLGEVIPELIKGFTKKDDKKKPNIPNKCEKIKINNLKFEIADIMWVLLVKA